MSIVLLLVFFTTLLVLGFGLNGWSLAALVIGFTIGLSFLMVSLDIQGIKDNWRDRRCDLDVLVTSFLYKPTSDPRTTGDFTSENFSFCTRQMIQDFLKVLITPLYAAIGKQLDMSNVLSQAMEALRFLKASMMDSFKKLLDPMFDRFIKGGMAFSQNFQRFFSSMRRVGGIAVATLYMGLSLVTTITNFTDFVIRVVLIIMAIIASMFIWSFYLFIPFLALLIITVNVLEEGGVDTGGFGALFCFDPSTSVVLQDGTKKAIDRLSVGDRLEDGGQVEGVLRVKALQEHLYSVDGILVSGSHLMWSRKEKDWIPVMESELATPSFKTPSYLVCLRTSTRNIVLRGSSGKPVLFRDWEELPLNVPEADSLWNYLVTKILGQAGNGEAPSSDPLCGPRCCVLLQTGEKLPISMVSIGTIVYSEQGFTKVIGVYEGEAELSSPSSLSSGIWVQSSKDWVHLPERKGVTQRGFHLVTQSGTFWIEGDNHSGFIRDFTEVGLEHLPLTYSFTHALLKKSLSREELCEPVSLSQASSSCSQLIF